MQKQKYNFFSICKLASHQDVNLLDEGFQDTLLEKAKEEGIQYYFVDNEFYFAGDKPYNELYQDIEKFAYFSKAVNKSARFLKLSVYAVCASSTSSGSGMISYPMLSR